MSTKGKDPKGTKSIKSNSKDKDKSIKEKPTEKKTEKDNQSVLSKNSKHTEKKEEEDITHIEKKKEEENNLDNKSHIHSSKMDDSRISGVVNLKNSMVKNDEEYDLAKKGGDEIVDPDQQQAENRNHIFLTAGIDLNNHKPDEIITYHDLIVPGGKNARLCLIHEPSSKVLRVSEIADHFKFHEPNPVINIIGGNSSKKGKLMAGLSRAAFNTRAYVVDSGIQTGVESFCIRKNITLIGIAPEYMIELPKPNPEIFSKKMLTNGHTHFVLIGNNENKLAWGEEARLKINLIERLITGRKGFDYKCKTVGIVMGNISNCEDEILYYIDRNYPLILIEDSEMSVAIKEIRSGENKEISDKNLNRIANYTKLIEIEDDSENLASAVHLCLTISF